MSEAFKKALAIVGTFNKNEEALLKQAVQTRTLAKNEAFLSFGEVSSEVAFLEKGSLRAYSLNAENEEITRELYLPEDWVMNYGSFSIRGASTIQILACEECQLSILNIEAIHFLIAQSQSFLQLGRLSAPKESDAIGLQSSGSPQEKYEQLLALRPQLLQKFPLKWIASYLNITPETLSRVRAKIAQK